MPRKRVSEKEIVVSTPVPTRRKPAVAPRKHAAPMPAAAPATELAPAPEAPSREQIAALAYSYWVARGYQGGSPEADWLRAEQELAGKPSLASAAIA
jgi:hypothetical protein